MRNLLAFILAVIPVALVHEGLHAGVAFLFDELAGFRVLPFGLEVLFRTPTAERDGLRWAAISGVPNVATVALGYTLLVARRAVLSTPSELVRGVGYWAALLCLVADPLNLSVGPFLYGGDALGVARGLGVDVALVQAIAGLVLLANRELAARVLLPAFGVRTGHPLFRRWLPGSPSPDQAGS